MKCKNCGHKIEQLSEGSFIKKYKDKSLWCHVRHLSWGFKPQRTCRCGCLKPEPTSIEELQEEIYRRQTRNRNCDRLMGELEELKSKMEKQK